MTRLRRSFTAEFKLEAASLVLDQGYSVPEASRSLDVGETVLRRHGFSSCNPNELAQPQSAKHLTP